jgi:hypothetical protein
VLEEIYETSKGDAAANGNKFHDGSDPYRITVPAQSVREGIKEIKVFSQILMAVTAAILITSLVGHRLQYLQVRMLLL